MEGKFIQNNSLKEIHVCIDKENPCVYVCVDRYIDTEINR
jgi:hypothetical protein